MTSFDGDTPQAGRGRYTVAWAGDTRVYATLGRWFAQVTIDHTVAVARAGERAGRVAPRPGDSELTSSVRTGSIGVSRLDLPVTRIVLAGRDFSAIPSARLREAIGWRRTAATVDELTRLQPAGTAIVVRPNPTPAAMNAARLAGQDQASGTRSTGPVATTPTRQARRSALALPVLRRG